jgi:small GTP-binding protein
MSEAKQTVKGYKTILVGNGKTGKTSIKRSYMGLEFIDNYYMTLGVEISVKSNEKFALQIWDLGGQSGFISILDTYIMGLDAAVIVFDITDRESFNKIEEWVNFVYTKSNKGVPIFIFGNKVDLRGSTYDEVTQDEAMALSKKLSQNSVYEVPYIETSAKTGFNIDYAFSYLMSILDTTTKK